MDRAVGASLYLRGEIDSVTYDEPIIEITGAMLFGFGCLVFVARKQTHQANRRTAVATICTGILGTTLIIVMLQPTWSATLAITPLLTVGVALPYASDRTLKLLIIAAWLVTATVTIFSTLYSPSSPLPSWLDALYCITSLLATVAVLLLILWQFRAAER